MGASLSRVTRQQWLRIWLPGVADSKKCHWTRWPQPPGTQARNRRMEGTCLGPRWALGLLWADNFQNQLRPRSQVRASAWS